MNIRNSIAKWVLGKYSFVGRENTNKSQLFDFSEARRQFSDVLFLNVVELLTDIANDVTLRLVKGDTMRFAEFKVFFDSYGQECLNLLISNGYIVIAYNSAGFFIIDRDTYTIDAKNAIKPNQTYKNTEVYVLKSDTYKISGKSDKVLLDGFLTYLDNVLNASNTTTARLGTLVMATPQQVSNSAIPAVITDIEKKAAEKEISEEYGGLKHQKQILIWRQSMQFTTINLSALDSKTISKARFAVQAICDRLKIPSNQVSIVNDGGGNGLSNGGELREGDLLKYKSFERLLSKTFVKMAKDLDMIIDYDIYNKPLQPIQNGQI